MPQTIVQASGRVAESIVGGLSAQPVLLLIVLLNMVMIFASGFYLVRQEETRSATQLAIIELIRACIDVGVHTESRPVAQGVI